ncbi:Coatomer subunit delta [Amphibalanus amphitrite]|uniref:Coatomer subunit delta n=1 Tax=Amphibalanus amphitrite TaxID=1232801 RepID=A0A6A4XAZ0_AMPAM|nr:Coatomer subunit delta [Amphibalanus amphitrite]
MVLLAAAVTTRSGKAILSRQFIEMPKPRIEGLLAAFPKLMSAGKQHTFVETDSVRYVYQPLDQLYVLLITTKASNILEDLDTLRLFTRVVPEYCGSMTESDVFDNAFSLIFAFDEIVALGYKESVNLSQVRTFVEMDSHEEKVYQAVRQTQEREAKQKMREKAKELQRQKYEAQKRGVSSMSYSGGSSGGSINVMPQVGDTASTYSEPRRPAPAPARPTGPSRALKLGKKARDADSFVDQLQSEGEQVAPRAPAGGPAAARAAPAVPVSSEPVALLVAEKLTLVAPRDGGLQNLELHGQMTLRITDESLARLQVQKQYRLSGGKEKTYVECINELTERNGGVTSMRDTLYCSCLSGKESDWYCQLNDIVMSQTYPPSTTTTAAFLAVAAAVAASNPEEPWDWVGDSRKLVMGLVAGCGLLCLLCWFCCRKRSTDTRPETEDGQAADGRSGTTTERLPYSRYGYRPPSTQRRIPYSQYEYRPAESQPPPAAAPVPSAPPRPETPPGAPPPYEPRSPSAPPSYDAVVNNDTRGLQTQTHPQVDKDAFRGQSTIRLKNVQKPFPVNTDVGVLRWRYQTTDESAIPLSINCWPSENGSGGCDVNIEYSLEDKNMELSDVVISVPLVRGTGDPVIAECDGTYTHDSRRPALLWNIPIVDGDNASGSMEFSAGGTPGDFFPVTVSFTSQKSMADIRVTGVTSVDTNEPIKHSVNVSLFPEKYEIV